MAEENNEPETRELFLFTDVTDETMQKLIEKIILFNEEDLKKEKTIVGFKRQPITININSPGGLVSPCLGLITVMKYSKTPIITKILGKASSCGAVIFLAGHQRYMSKYSRMLIHNISGGAFGQIQDVEQRVEEIKVLIELWKDVTLEGAPKLKRKELEKWFASKTDVVLGLKEAKKYGMVTGEYYG